jgi:hypothetical protein
MTFLLRMAIQMILSFVHFVAVVTSKLYLAMLRIYMSPEVLRIPECRRAVVALVLTRPFRIV